MSEPTWDDDSSAPPIVKLWRRVVELEETVNGLNQAVHWFLDKAKEREQEAREAREKAAAYQRYLDKARERGMASLDEVFEALDMADEVMEARAPAARRGERS